MKEKNLGFFTKELSFLFSRLPDSVFMGLFMRLFFFIVADFSYDFFGYQTQSITFFLLNFFILRKRTKEKHCLCR